MKAINEMTFERWWKMTGNVLKNFPDVTKTGETAARDSVRHMGRTYDALGEFQAELAAMQDAHDRSERLMGDRCP